MEKDKNVPFGLCINCAKELNVGSINKMIEQLGISDEELEQASEQMSQFMENMDDFDFGSLGEMFNNENMDGAQTLPFSKLMDSALDGTGQADGDKKQSTSKKKRAKGQQQNERRKFLNNYCNNLTDRAKSGKLDNIIGRESEIERTVQILCRRTKNNPCLIGEPGVGKTAIAEGLAIKIAKGEVPARLADKEIYLLDLTALVAGTQFRGQFEGRIKGLVDEVRSEGNIILFIDEVHNLVGTGDSEGTMNAANILKPALSRGEIQVIGATTFNEYRKHIEKDAALERRFQPVKIEEPSIDDTCRMLMGIKHYYENYHKVSVSDTLIRRAVTMSERYVTDRYLPDKAIDLLDEACTCANLRNPAISEYQLLLEKKEKINSAIETLSNPQDDKEIIDYEKISNLKTQLLQLEEKESELSEKASRNQVYEQDLAKVVSMWTGIPASKIEAGDIIKLGSLEAELKKYIIGQDEAIEKVADAVRRGRIQISPVKRPQSFIFVGPTGVGKTELVKRLAAYLFDSPESLIRLDMSEYMEKFSVSRIIGSPPGYVGYDDAGQLTEKVRRKPYSVILFDEIEKAHKDVLNILLQILDEGRITDAQGRTVNFENTIIIMTSNAGSTDTATVGFGKTANEISKDVTMKALEKFLRPEFLGRVDEIITFNVLSFSSYEKIALIMLDELKQGLADKGIEFVYDDCVAVFVAKKSYGSKKNARSIRDNVRHYVEDKLAREIVNKQGAAINKFTLSAGEDIEIKIN
ncbi:MAG: ATP-dependent Clp protease ATP-binding subunit [Clostridiales bacterium]|nr:ATP-dependent Clp protease ATP-binding subunit [Clostridiales bacterium]